MECASVRSTSRRGGGRRSKPHHCVACFKTANDAVKSTFRGRNGSDIARLAHSMRTRKPVCAWSA
eukprot:10528575-Lingulodinium_polyedra.AAC.1